MKQIIFVAFVCLVGLCVGVCRTEPLQKGEVSQMQEKEIFRFAQYDNIESSLRESRSERSNTRIAMNLESTNEKVECVDCHESANADSRNNESTARLPRSGFALARNDKNVVGEISGVIVGLGLNYSSFRFTQNYEQIVTEISSVAGASGADARVMTTTTTQLESPINAQGSGIGSSLIIGYQGFSTPFSQVVQLGVRVYGDFDTKQMRLKNNNTRATMLRYGINTDIMINFIMPKHIGLGAFVGVRIGGVSYFGNDTKAINKRLHTLNNGSFPKGSFDFALNVGLRANIARHNGIELVFALPIFEMNYKASDENVINDRTTATRLRGDFKEQWSVGVRYIWAFAGKRTKQH